MRLPAFIPPAQHNRARGIAWQFDEYDSLRPRSPEELSEDGGGMLAAHRNVTVATSLPR
jgi:hypothetical protein